MYDKDMFAGKTALITGSTSGIGLSIAKAFARSGATIVMNGMGDQSAIDDAIADVKSVSSSPVEFNAADLRKPDEIESMFSGIAAEIGGIDILVNNAGIQQVAPIEDFPADKWDEILAVNLTAAFHTTRQAVPYMKRSGWGRIVNVASAHALVASPFKSAYVAAKHGLAGLTKVCALELATSNVTVNAIAPGYVETPLVTDQLADSAQARSISIDEVVSEVVVAAQPTGKLVGAEGVASLVVYLCSDAAEAITGAIMPIDGGWTAR